MIDMECRILIQGKGFCWCPSSAWGVSDQQLCQLCQVKNSQVKEKIGPLGITNSAGPASAPRKGIRQTKTKAASSIR